MGEVLRLEWTWIDGSVQMIGVSSEKRRVLSFVDTSPFLIRDGKYYFDKKVSIRQPSPFASRF